MRKKFSPQKRYLPPKIVAVQIVVEAGYSGSQPLLSPLELETWNTASHSGENFWSDADIGGSTESYSTFDWSW